MGAPVNAWKRLLRASYSFGRAPAHSSATLTGEYKTATSELLKSIHLETMSVSLPRETSIRMSESTRTVIAREADLNEYLGGDFEPAPQRREFASDHDEFPRTPALPSSVHPASRSIDRERLLAQVPRCWSFDSGRKHAGHSRDDRRDKVESAA